MESKPEQSKAAIASFVLGILSLFSFFLTGIPAIIFGIIALVKIGRSGGLLKGKGFAIAGIILSAVSMIITLIILIGLLIPAFREVEDYSRKIQQKSQFHSIEVGLEIFKSDFGTYPDSFDNRAAAANSPVSPLTADSKNYCGAQKLAEALFGQDLLGFHPDSKFRSDGMDDSGKSLYVPETRKARKGPYIELEIVNMYRLKDIFEDVGNFDGNSFVICDVYEKARYSGKKTGMPILYYRASTSGPVAERIYNAGDNLSLIRTGKTSDGKTHPLAEDNGRFFYDKDYKIIDQKVPAKDRPRNPDTFILISAGPDGLYGTSDDIVNFEEEIEK